MRLLLLTLPQVDEQVTPRHDADEDEVGGDKPVADPHGHKIPLLYRGDTRTVVGYWNGKSLNHRDAKEGEENEGPEDEPVRNVLALRPRDSSLRINDEHEED